MNTRDVALVVLVLVDSNRAWPDDMHHNCRIRTLFTSIMAPLPTRQALESMKRTDLQRICKVRAQFRTFCTFRPFTGIRRQGEPQVRSPDRSAARDPVRVVVAQLGLDFSCFADPPATLSIHFPSPSPSHPNRRPDDQFQHGSQIKLDQAESLLSLFMILHRMTALHKLVTDPYPRNPRQTTHLRSLRHEHAKERSPRQGWA